MKLTVHYTFKNENKTRFSIATTIKVLDKDFAISADMVVVLRIVVVAV
jgi:hypothetical protein